MRHLSVKEICHLDRLASKKYGIPSLILMENAGRTVAEETLKLLNRLTAHPLVAIFCGGGNNGGDGFVAARYLLNKGANIRLCLLKKPTEISPDASTNLNILKHLRLRPKIIFDRNLKFLSKELRSADIIIDAIFGTGLKSEVTGIHAKVIEMINQSNKPVISVDIPSGLDADTGLPLPCTALVQGLGEPRKDFSARGKCIKAKITVTMGYPKRGFLNPKAKKFIGKVVVADIGYPRRIFREISK